MKTLNVLALLTLVGCLAVSAPASAKSKTPGAAGLRAGTAKIDITPESPRYPVHDPLQARSLILEADGTRVAFISLDLSSYVNPEFSATLKEKFDLDEVFFSASHTHSGERAPAGWLEDRLTKVVDEASGHMFEANISAGHRSFPQLGFNRMIVREDGWAREVWKYDDHYLSINTERRPFGPVDPAVGILKIEDAKGETRALVMNYACHTDAVWGNFAISADWVGVATRMTEEAYEGKINCLFINGAAGNVAPMFKDPGRKGPDDPRDTDYNLIERMGKLLSIEAVKLARSLRYDPEAVESVKFKTDAMHFTGRFDKSLDMDIHFSTLLINDQIALATFPGEPFIKFQLDWKAELADEAIPFFFGYTWNGGEWPIYVPDIKSAALGGFGADQGPVRIEVGAGEAIMNRQLENFYIINGRMRPEPGPVD